MRTDEHDHEDTEHEHDSSALTVDEREDGGAPRRRADGRLLPGRSLNPGGKVAGVGQITRMLAQYIRDETDECRELADILLRIARGKPGPAGTVPSVIQQRAAAEYLWDRVCGRPMQPVAVDVGASLEAVVDVEAAALAGGLNLDALERVLDLALGGPGAALPMFEASAIERPDPGQSDVRMLDVKAIERPGTGQYVQQPSDVKLSGALYRVRLPVSAQIEGATWDPETGDCVVTFRGKPGEPRARWVYERLTREQIREWEESPSAGGWFGRELRGGSGREGAAGKHLKHPRRRLPDLPPDPTRAPRKVDAGPVVT